MTSAVPSAPMFAVAFTPRLDVSIHPRDGRASLISGHPGLSSVARVEGCIRVRGAPRCRRPVPPRAVSAKFVGSIFSSSGDARRHSPYEAHRFLTVGPDVLFSSDLPDASFPSTSFWNENLWLWEIPFMFPISWTAGASKIHESISASNPEWGFGARIEYKIIVTVKTDSTGIGTPAIFSFPRYWRSFFDFIYPSSSTIEFPVQIMKYDPELLKTILWQKDNPKSCVTWCSESDAFEEEISLKVRRHFQYAATLFSAVFGPGDTVRFEFRVRAKQSSRLKIDSVKVWLEEIQGVGICMDSKKKEDIRNSKEGHVNPNTEEDHDRRCLVLELLSWNGSEDFDGDFWQAVQQAFDLPPANVTVTPYNASEAVEIVSCYPALASEIVRESKDRALVRKLMESCLDRQTSQMSLDETIVEPDSTDDLSQISFNPTSSESDVECWADANEK
ncbi:hypothetical protein HDU84_000077 [Entophlyctis sp. JEL0112]|nr:hypothetical protein HDU84_000077 [Entophlyctis sp. JEL0112]